ncbi:hypothetical protein K2173_018733 [Erythroxylum novogranatense]|uniref:Endoplasmic reticulum transmembrane protein n=1 Tax=Erythroxylum novogranatense TaxID=1862640 RepID=A0AAV8SB08_9ROSI|nr:hypothetical protein K2173_018733 [Erythroxylum novogranatense]
MLQLLYTVVFSETVMIMVLLFDNPFRKLLIMTLDLVKRGRGPVVVKTVAGTVFVVLMSDVASIVEIQNRTMEGGVLNPTDEVLMSRNMLEASLMGFLLLLSLMIDRLHHYIRELRLLRKTMESVKKQEGENGTGKAKAMTQEIADLKAIIKNLEDQCESKDNEAKTAEAEVRTLSKQFDDLVVEHDRLVEENRLTSIDQGESAKKNA